MGTVSAKDLRASLEKARDMGLVEEKFDLCGHTLVVRNLRPSEVEAVIAACKGLEDLSYFNTYQREHVARGLCEINGFDLREVEFIDDEEPDPKNKGQVKKVRIERHKWVAEQFLSTWGSDPILIAYRKIGDCTTEAEKQSKEGVTFRQADETPEQKYRRILGELKEAEEDVPVRLLDEALEEVGLVRKSTLDELKAAEERLNRLRDAELAAEKEARVKAEAEAQPPPPPPPAPPKAADIMAQRKPLNQAEAPPPEVAPVQPPAGAVVRPATPPSRAAELAALESDADAVGVLASGPIAPKPTEAFRMSEVATIGGSSTPAPVDPEKRAAEQRSIIDQPARGGLNPKYRPPPRA